MTQAMHQVLVIEDEPAIRSVLRVLLQAEGYRCIEADTAMRAEIEARSHKPDLLLIDLGLPDADGLKVIRRVRVDLARRESAGPAGEIHLTPLEYRVLICLARQLGSIVMQQQLIREVWGPERQDDSRSLRVCIKNLRAKLEPDPRQPRYLLTETGLGYRLRADELNEPATAG